MVCQLCGLQTSCNIGGAGWDPVPLLARLQEEDSSLSVCRSGGKDKTYHMTKSLPLGVLSLALNHKGYTIEPILNLLTYSASCLYLSSERADINYLSGIQVRILGGGNNKKLEG